ncbi:MAG: RHS repeat-associated core domain-containing protein, partial [candidate division WOR-3 bacterium]
YDASGRLSKTELPNNTITEFNYDKQDRITLISSPTGGNPIPGYPINYEYDKNGNIVKEVIPAGTITNQYDALNRLTKQNHPIAGEFVYQYDANGNRIMSNEAGQITTYQYLDDNILRQSGLGQFSHNANGELTSINSSQGNFQFHYDPEGKLISVTNQSRNETIRYSYNGLGELIGRFSDVPSVLPKFILNRSYYLNEYGNTISEPLSVYNSDGTNNYRYHLGGFNPDMIDNYWGISNQSNQFIFHKDVRGSVVKVTNQTQQDCGGAVYGPFGQVLQYNGPSINDVMFTGKIYDQSTGLLNLRNRNYLPKIGRFTSKDPLGFIDGLNPFTYTNNNPTSFIDPFGLQMKEFSLKTGSKDKPLTTDNYLKNHPFSGIKWTVPDYIRLVNYPDFELELYFSQEVRGQAEVWKTNKRRIKNGDICYDTWDGQLVTPIEMEYLYLLVQLWFKVAIDQKIIERANKELANAQNWNTAATGVAVTSTAGGLLPVIGPAISIVGFVAGTAISNAASGSYEDAIKNLNDALKGAKAQMEKVNIIFEHWKEFLREEIQPISGKLMSEPYPCPDPKISERNGYRSSEENRRTFPVEPKPKEPISNFVPWKYFCEDCQDDYNQSESLFPKSDLPHLRDELLPDPFSNNLLQDFKLFFDMAEPAPSKFEKNEGIQLDNIIKPIKLNGNLTRPYEFRIIEFDMYMSIENNIKVKIYNHNENEIKFHLEKYNNKLSDYIENQTLKYYKGTMLTNPKRNAVPKSLNDFRLFIPYSIPYDIINKF